MPILNLGILAHVDAGKTTLTERILFETGVIAAAGSVDSGTTQTDTLELERARGITIKAAVVSFQLRELKVNLIDTPGHADFIAEVARSLRVLDAVVLVVSAVEGVQPQTRRLANAIRSAGLPTIVFVNKIDRVGARGEALLADIREKLRLRLLPFTLAVGLGDRAARVAIRDRAGTTWRTAAIDLLAETDDRVIEAFEQTGGELSASFLTNAIRAQIDAGAIVPVYFGSATTGAGVAELLAGIAEWLPVCSATGAGPPAASVFKVTRQATGEKLVYVRVFAGALVARQRVELQRRAAGGDLERIEGRVSGIDRFVSGTIAPADTVVAGDIARLHGLRVARIGDRIGAGVAGREEAGGVFPPPALESVVRPVEPGQLTRLRAALEELEEQDPLIALRQRNEEGEIAVRLYGEVQKEVIAETLAREYGIGATFGPSQTICIERPTGTGEAAEVIFASDNPFYATVGLRIERAKPGSGLRYASELGALPLAFYRAIEETVRATLRQGLYGWEVTDCAVTLTQVGMCPISGASDFRKLTPLVLMRALQRAGTAVCEPVEALTLEIPDDAYGAVCGVLVNARGTIIDAVQLGTTRRLLCELPTAELRAVERQLPRLTHGDGGWESRLVGYAQVSEPRPRRSRAGPNPLNRAHYLADVARR